MSTPQGWYPDPSGGDFERLWNGTQWTENSRPFSTGRSPGKTPPPTAGYPGASGTQPPPPSGGYERPHASAPEYAIPSMGSDYAGTGHSGGYMTPPIGTWRGPIDDRPIVNNPIAAIRVWFSKYVQFDGRASRSEYWWGVLAFTIVYLGLYVLAVVSFALGPSGSALRPFLLLVFLVIAFGSLLPQLAVWVRRLRDAGIHWALIFLSFVPLGGIAVLVFTLMPSKFPDNRYVRM